MDWKTFTVEFTKTVAWPISILVVVCVFKKQIRELIERIEFWEAKAGDKALKVWARRIAQKTKPAKKDIDTLTSSLASEDPQKIKQAIRESWESYKDTFKKAHGIHTTYSWEDSMLILDDKSIPEEDIKIFKDIEAYKDVVEYASPSLVQSSGTAPSYIAAIKTSSERIKEKMKETQTVIRAIHEYLQKEFPSAKHVEPRKDSERLGYKFIITTKDHVMITSISRKFINDNDSETAILELNDTEIINLLKKNPDSTIVVRGKSDREPFFKIEPRNHMDCL